MTFLDSITLTRTLPCLAEPGKMIVIGKPARTLEEVLPYLATLPGIIAYNPEQCTLTFRRQPGFLTIQRDQVYITQVKDVQEGLELLAALTESIDVVWEHRQELVAVTASKRTPRPLDIWSLLPQTNCKQCGELTCMAFAVGLLQQNRMLNECTVLQADADFSDRRFTLETML
ncbi:MAG: (Fe-S)-binding protein [Anaerolineales bacterium]|nr:(Fe-S)-binding protein [Anaerolineales bacterium]